MFFEVEAELGKISYWQAQFQFASSVPVERKVAFLSHVTDNTPSTLGQHHVYPKSSPSYPTCLKGAYQGFCQALFQFAKLVTVELKVAVTFSSNENNNKNKNKNLT